MQKMVVAIAMTLALPACAIQSADKSLETWQNYGIRQPNVANLKEDQALVVFNCQNNVNGNAINVYVNNDYLVLLLTNSFMSISVCASKQLFCTSFVTNNSFINCAKSLTQILSYKKNTYIKMISGQLAFQKINEAEVRIAFGLKQIIKALSRAEFVGQTKVFDNNKISKPKAITYYDSEANNLKFLQNFM